jgi:GNAT superfamily N-acetyltransferase
MTSDEPPTPDPFEKIALGGSKLIIPITPSEFERFDKEHNSALLDDKMSRSMLSGSRTAVMAWGTPCIGLMVDYELLSVNVTSIHKKPKNAWGRYINVYLAYTVPAHRYKGYASTLVEHLEKEALAEGCTRMKSLAGSWAGVRLHMHFGHHFYGVAKNGELVVDTPLISGLTFPDGIPVDVRNRTVGEARLQTRDDLIEILTTSERFKDSMAGRPAAERAVDRYFERMRR